MKIFYVRKASVALFEKHVIPKSDSLFNFNNFIYFCIDPKNNSNVFFRYRLIENNADAKFVKKLRLKIFCLTRRQFMAFQNRTEPMQIAELTDAKTFPDEKSEINTDLVEAHHSDFDAQLESLTVHLPDEYEKDAVNDEFQTSSLLEFNARLKAFIPDPGCKAPPRTPLELKLSTHLKSSASQVNSKTDFKKDCKEPSSFLQALCEKIKATDFRDEVFLGVVACLQHFVEKNNRRIIIQDSIFFSPDPLVDIEFFLRDLIDYNGINKYELIAAFHYLLLYIQLPGTSEFVTDYLHEHNIKRLILAACLVAWKKME